MATRSAEELFYDALARQQENALPEAENLYRAALQLAPDRPSILLNLATVLVGLGRLDEAEPLLLRLLELDPDDTEALVTLGACQSSTGRKDDALSNFDRALKQDPQSVDAWNGHGNVLVDLGRPQEALESFEHALALAPDHPDVLNNRGSALLALHRHTDALNSFSRAVQLHPDFAVALNNRGNALLELNDIHAAAENFSEASRILPGYARARWNESLCRLCLGEFASGWELYESGWEDGQRGEKLNLDAPWWDGSHVRGKLLAWGEQGIGDQILHAGMIAELALMADALIVAVDARLVPLFQRSFPNVTVVAKDNSLAQMSVARQIALGSVGQYLRKSWQDFSQTKNNYLISKGNLSSHLRVRLGNARHCGVSWISRNNRFAQEKSLALSDLAPLLKITGIHAVDLQYGNTIDERLGLEQQHGIQLTHVDDIDNFNDIDGLAALIDACDAVVTVSNTTAHLAGALGKPTLLLVPFGAGRHWYWHQNRNDSPWYPSIRIFRQRKQGDWTDPIRQACDALICG